MQCSSRNTDKRKQRAAAMGSRNRASERVDLTEPNDDDESGDSDSSSAMRDVGEEDALIHPVAVLPPVVDSVNSSANGPRKGGNPKATRLSEADARVAAIGDIVAALTQSLKAGKIGSLDLASVRTTASRRYGLARAPKLVEILAAVPPEHRAMLAPLLRAKPVRTASGIAVVAVMSKPHRCPHIATTGNICVYCPGGPDSDFEYSTQSYTGYEPTSMRAIRAR